MVDTRMRKTKEINIPNENGENLHFLITALSARDGFALMQNGTLLLAKAGVIGSMLNNSSESGEQASGFDFSTFQNAKLNDKDLLDFEAALLRSVTYISEKGTIVQIDWDNIDQYCASPKEVFELLKEAFNINFGFLKNALGSMSQTSSAADMGKNNKPKITSRRPTFQAR